ncbi:hypothetical protein SDC9_169908 [bioreactor metagenome]|uniref:PPM-type phosphatase domain-containing protein n=1 Tax=bioreactor metagenome TaxID=1076179 RepID=A0A645G7A4_9ZZZZ
MSSLCGVSLENLDIENRGGLYALVMTQKERFDVVHAMALRKKDGEDTSGDKINTFKHEGHFISSLCDAMGSGKRAAIDSSLACCVIENIVKGGFDGEMAIKSLNTAMMIGNDEDRVTSVDIAAIDLFTGKAILFKAGGAPTYAKKGNTIHRLFHPSLPVGILENTQPQQLTLTLQQDDILIMLSDGVCDEDNDGLLKQEILAFKGNDLNGLCERIIENAVFAGEGRSKDDMSVIAMKLV